MTKTGDPVADSLRDLVLRVQKLESDVYADKRQAERPTNRQLAGLLRITYGEMNATGWTKIDHIIDAADRLDDLSASAQTRD
jgi:hypothetical protein